MYARLRPHNQNNTIAASAMCYGREEEFWASVITGRDAPPVLELAKHVLNFVAEFVT